MTTVTSSWAAPVPLLIFDGDCGFCTTAVAWAERSLPSPPSTIPHQWADLAALGLTRVDAADRLWLVTSDARYGGHLAVSTLFRHQPDFAMRFQGWLIATPPFSLVAAITYRLVARYRHRLPGGTPACRSGPPEERV